MFDISSEGIHRRQDSKGFYNDVRPHSFTGGLSPVEYEKQWEEAKIVSGNA
ncbi:conserved hypothetical protein [Xenorhabdus nematophila F1]|uniref:Uncharacterized protein n=1 Tax=Xenorhabdus nematophila (strain ATCC 19061 / DSM 3370 / CCUG 14189 / LMG 1036 / NCIMB 9965 / AN6) TaxID=406817 RepID=D3VDT5_XENNA|nr:hypothetical protein XNC1_1942 [Xenorhabdus nematophila ATCC 19061]CCW30150.1 conserved hypothetical protein [Xenorhabdus nematophila F1]CEK22878.1 hypothetical protein XNC2_1884 [Xenorhabdus nematophila AN6/1]